MTISSAMVAKEKPVELGDNEKHLVAWVLDAHGAPCAKDVEGVLKKELLRLTVPTMTQADAIRRKANFFGLPPEALGRA